MKKQFRRMASWLCVLALCLGLLPGTALADGDSPEESGAPACTMSENCEAVEHKEGCPAAASNDIEPYAEEEEGEDTSVAQIGEQKYATLQAAINAATDESTEIKLIADTTENVTVESDDDIVLDLNGCTLTNTDGNHTITNSGTLTIKDSAGNGKVDNVSHGKGALVNNAGGKVTLEGGELTRSAEAGSSPTNNGGNSWYVVDNHGTLDVTGGTIVNTSKYSSLIRNLGTMNVSGGTIQQDDFIAIKNDEAASQGKYGKLTITGGTIISSEQAIQNWQEAEISGGTINGPVYTWGYESGSTALVGETEITGGTITGNIGIAIDGSYTSSTEKRPSVSISGDADITGDVVTDTVGTEGTVTISGVTITGDVTNNAKTSFIISDGAVITGNVTSGTTGTTTVVESTVQGTVDGNSIVVNSTVNGEPTTQAPENVAAIIGTTTYETLAAAVQAAESGDTVTLLKDVENGSGIKVESNKSLTIDFAGHTYTVTNDLAGSSGTETQCFQLLKGSTIVMKNGAVVANNSGIQMIIQNYSDLTLEDMTLDATQGNNNVTYVLSNNFGDTTITGNTNITAREGQAAFDLYYWPSHSNGIYADGVSVTVDENMTGTITGRIEYGSDNSETGKNSITEKADLEIEAGTFIGEFKTYGLNEETTATINISGGAFSTSVSEYVVEDLNAELNSNGVYTYYTDVETALENAKPGDTITDLSGSGEFSEPVAVVTVTYDDGGHGTAPTGHTVTAGTTVILKDMADTDDYAFTGWSDGDATYQPGDTLKVTGNITLTAQWERKATEIEPVYVRYIVEHWLEGRWDYELEETESFIGEIGEIVTAQPKDYPGYRYNASISTASDTLTEINGEDDIVVLKLYYDERTTSRPSGGGSEPSYTVSVEDADHGEITVSPKRAQEGDEVTITATPDEGYELDTLTVTDKDGDELRLTENRDGTFSFEMPDSRVTIQATFVPVEEEPVVTTPVTWTNLFTDVASGAWYYDAVGYVYTNGVMTGVTPTAFSPDTTTTRAQIWTILARLNGQNVEGGSPWYAAAQQWAVSAGVSDGTDPDAPITREQLAAMLYRAAGSPAVSGNLLAYPDGNAVSPWAESAMLWATQNGIITGIDGALTPQGSATRAQVAAMLTRAQ